MSTSSQLKVIIERSSKYYINKHIDKYLQKIEATTKQWRKWVRQQLSKKWVKGTLSTGLYPQLRNGDLRASLYARKAKVKSNRKLSNGRAQVEIVIPTSYRKLKDDYGELLNSDIKFASSSFFGWKSRVNDNLLQRIKGRS